MTILQSGLAESGGYNIDRSLRFRSSASAYLSRTYSTGGTSRQIQTASFWVKRGSIGVTYAYMFGAYDGSSTYDAGISFQSDALAIYVGGVSSTLITTQVFRDPSAWYHIVIAIDTTQVTAANRIKVYVNGSQVTAFSTATYPAQNSNIDFLYANANNKIGVNWNGNASTYFDGYLAEVNFIDGQALTPSSFGEFSTETGVWVPKKYTGTYGTNGFYLDFKDNTSATTLAYDKSGNGNNWTPNNISTTAGPSYDSMTDVPTLTSATAANFCVGNPLSLGSNASLSNANLSGTLTGSGGWSATICGLTSGKWYWEATPTANSGNSMWVGFLSDVYTKNDNDWSYSTQSALYANDGRNGNNASYGATWTTNDVIGIALDLSTSSGSITFYKNGVSQGTMFSSLTSSAAWRPLISGGGTGTTIAMNFGQRPFAYTPPTGFKALNTFNLPDPVIKNGLTVFDATTWTGFGTTTQVNVSGKFKPDLVWIKGRSGATSHRLTDSVRGATYALSSDSPSSNTITDTQGLTSFNSGGFTVGSNTTYNANGSTYIAWQWKKGATQGFDISSVFTGTGAAQTVNHSLGVAPSMIILFSTGGTNWINARVYHKNLSAGYVLQLSRTSAQFSEPTTFASIGSSSFQTTQTSGQTSVAYLFAEIAGFSKFGSYTGNGSTDGPFVYCGFRPKYVLIKSSSGVTDWNLFDSVRGPDNPNTPILRPNSSGAEATASSSSYAMPDFLSNGFKLRTTSGEGNASGGTYIFAAFAENPFKYSLAR